MNQKKAYFDHNATTPIRPKAMDALLAALSDTGNPSSIHSYGRAARKQIETARKQIAECLDVSTGQVFFNSGATEGNNTIIKTFQGKPVLVSAIEHPSVIECGTGHNLIPVTTDGLIDLDRFAEQVKTISPALVSVMLVNNETGVIQPVAEVARIAKAAGALVHCDAVQAFGRTLLTREDLGVDFLTLSSHKIGGGMGSGAVVVAPNTSLPRLLEGGGQERRSRAGTENVPGIASFGAAAIDAVSSLDEFATLSQFQSWIESALMDCPSVRIYGQNSPRVANTISCTIDGVAGDTLLMAFDIEGIALSSGSACSSGTVKFSHVLKAMGVEEKKDRAALRVSMGYTTTEKDVEHFIAVWNNLRARLLKD